MFIGTLCFLKQLPQTWLSTDGASSLAPPEPKGWECFLGKSPLFLLVLATVEYFSFDIREKQVWVSLNLRHAEVQVQLPETLQSHCRSGLATKLIPVPPRLVLSGTHFSSLKDHVLQ